MFQQPQVATVDVEEAASRLAGGAVLIDVREQSEWDAERIPGSVHRPIATIDEWWEDLPADRDVLVVCHTGGRSAQVVHALSGQGGMTNVWNLAGGIVAWADSGRPVDAPEGD